MSKDLLHGSILHCLETATLGMPLESWKTRMCVYRNENTITSFSNICKKGALQFYAGFYAKLVESATKGAVLLVSKEQILEVCNTLNVNKTTAGFIAGACGGVCQSLVMTPCTFFITASIDKQISYTQKIKSIIKKSGVSTLYKGNMAMCLRQGTNWASRQGITEFVRNQMLQRKKKQTVEHELGIGVGGSDKNRKNELYQQNKNKRQNSNTDDVITSKEVKGVKEVKEIKGEKGEEGEKETKALTLTTQEEILCGVIGGALSVWNNPFDVIRVYMQSNANKNIKMHFFQSFVNLYKEGGVMVLYKGVIPRCLLCIWQTLFMVTGVKIINNYL